MTYRKVLMDFDRIKWWLVQGATATLDAQSLLSMAGLMPAPLSQAGHRHMQRFDWGKKDDLYQYWLKTRPTPEQLAKEERYNYYDSANGEQTTEGKRDLEREEMRTKILNQLETPAGIREQLLGTQVSPLFLVAQAVFFFVQWMGFIFEVQELEIPF